jgi:acetylornithine deacetylase/succinyl-diaminopimelate desuccinylase-like protein
VSVRVRLPDAVLRASAGGRAMASGDLAQHSTRRGAVTVSSWRTDGAPGSIPRSASATLDVRLPPGTDPDAAASAVVEALERSHGARCLTITVLRRSRGDCLPLPRRVRQAVRAACHAGYGQGPVALASGGSLPAVAVLQAAVRAPVVLLGLGPHDDGAHGPDEYLDLADWARAVDTCVCLVAELGHVRRSPRSTAEGRDSGWRREGVR